jgi:prepilin-type N-terminal cleavage/methylation domain-containing protein
LHLMSKRRGFVLTELLVVLTAIAALGVIEEGVRPPLERLCVGSGKSASAERPRVMLDVERWLCVPLARVEDAENEFVKLRENAYGRAPSPSDSGPHARAER